MADAGFPENLGKTTQPAGTPTTANQKGSIAVFVNQIISALILTILFLPIPLIWWLFTARKKTSFFRWLGLTRVRTDNPRKLVIATALVVVFFTVISLAFVPALAGKTGDSHFSGLGWAALTPMLLKTVYQTAFLEELFFRGFLMKRIAAKFGYGVGNAAQALLFGLMHSVPMALQGFSIPLAIAVTILTGGIGWFMAWLNEKLAGGSILPSYLVHLISNLFGTALVLLGIV